MARIREEAAPAASAGTTAHHKKAIRRWFSAAAIFALMITATVIGSHVLPLDRGGSVAPATMNQEALNKATPREASGSQDAVTQIATLPTPEADQSAQSTPTGDLPEETTRAVAQHSADSTLKAAEGSSGGSSSGGGNGARALTNPEAETTTSSPTAHGAYGGSTQTLTKDTLTTQSSPGENAYVAGDMPESQAASSDDKGPLAELPLDAEAAKSLLCEYLALPPSNPPTVTYEGLTPAGDAHLFLVTWPEEIRQTYSVDRAEGTVTLLPASDSQSPPAP